MRDEAEIRGHRRTYIGAMPGTIIRALRDAESKNPLFMIDEIDKMGADYRGDPASAMLEVLDPEQNATFRDHYLDVPFDLSNVMFITTGNTLDTIPGPLRDRMEIIQLAGYTEEEKLEIAKRYLVPRQIERNGLKKSWISFSDAALRTVIRDYTREAGVRNLEREIGTLCRKVARQVAESSNGKPGADVDLRAARVRELLGPPALLLGGQAPHPPAGRGHRPGVDARRRRRALHRGHRVRGRGQADHHRPARRRDARVRAGGALLRAQPSRASSPRARTSSGSPSTTSTSTCPRARRRRTGRAPASRWPPRSCRCITAAPVRDDVAMTGEITLTGQVLPIGGLKEKALAAQRSGVRTIIAPALNERDIEDIPEHLRDDLEFVFVEEIGEVLAVALGAAPSANGRRRSRAAAQSRV